MRNSILALLGVAALALAGFVGVAIARQDVSGAVGANVYDRSFARRSEIFQFVASSAQFRQSPHDGYYFVVAPDRAGRLPVVTQMLAGNKTNSSTDNVAQLQRKVGTRYLDYLVGRTAGTRSSTSPSSVETFSPGVVLVPGEYVLRVDDDNGSRYNGRPVLSGYWALP